MSSVKLHAGLLLALAALACCSHTSYKIRLRDGSEIFTASEPKFISKTGYYRYRALSGKDALVRADEVLRLERQ